MRGSAIVINVGNKIEAKRLLANGLHFGGTVKKLEKYCKAGPRLVYIRCCEIGHKCQCSCADRPEKCVICTGPHAVNEYQCGINRCNKKKGKLCIHIVAQSVNC